MTTPSTDPTGDLEQFIGQYIAPGTVESLIRTWVPVGIGSVIAWLAVDCHLVVPAGASATFGLVAGAVAVAVYYAVARLVEQRWPRVGRLLIALNLTKARPLYADSRAAPPPAR